MKSRFLVSLLLVIGIFLSFNWADSAAARSNSSVQEMAKKKKKKNKTKKPKKKKKSSSSKTKEEDPKKVAKEKERAKKEKEKRDKKHEKKTQKLLAEREKDKAKKEKERNKNRRDYTKCDSTDIKRTSKDSLILIKYMKVYRGLGGLCYILHLQEMARLEKTSDGHYTVEMKPSNDPRAPADWQTYLYCPIGKPDGLVALVSPVGDTVQTCNYLSEKKEGMMTYYKNKKIKYEEKYVNDEKIAAKEIEYDGN